MNLEKKKAFIIQVAYYGLIAVIALVALKFLFAPLLPFILGFICAWFIHKPARALARRLHLTAKIPAVAIAAVFYVIVFLAATMAGLQALSALEHFVPQIPVIYKQIAPYITQSVAEIEVYLEDVDPEIVKLIDRLVRQLMTNVERMISNLSVSAVRVVSGLITSLPNVILSVILTVISTFFISMDYDRVTGFLRSKLPAKMQSTLSETVDTGLNSIRKILGSYILILMMSFVELSIGLLLLKIPYAVGVALLIAVIDIMPVLGTGLILIPWALIALVLGHFRMGLGVALLYIVMLIVRNIVEPKLVGQQMGLHPLATLVSMFVGLQLFGILGLFGFPVALSLWLKLAKGSRMIKESAQEAQKEAVQDADAAQEAPAQSE